MTETYKKCPVCKKKFVVMDVKNPQETCGRLVCVTNMEYQKKHYDQSTGDKPTFEKINKL